MLKKLRQYLNQRKKLQMMLDFFEKTPAQSEEAIKKECLQISQNGILKNLAMKEVGNLEAEIIYDLDNIPITTTAAELKRFQINGIVSFINRIEQIAVDSQPYDDYDKFQVI